MSNANGLDTVWLIVLYMLQPDNPRLQGGLEGDICYACSAACERR